jgi:large-conductance mechanosensitive channel
METGFLRLMGVFMSVLPERIMSLDIVLPPTDVAPPPVLLGGLALGVLIALCLLVVVVAVVAFFVIRAIKKNRAKDVPPAQNNPTDPTP